ncbi:MAG: SAM-dependent methyltransferase [Candidatus Hodarchaeales archaeon]
MRRKRDRYTKKAKSEGYRSRAAYKLFQIDEKFKLFHENQIIIDLCGAPGGFSQVSRDLTKGKANIFLIDMARIKTIPNITEIIKGDITKLTTILLLQEKVTRYMSKDKEIFVLADCSPKVSGNWNTDHARQIWLAEVALGISNFFLAEKFLTKVFQGEELKKFLMKIREFYSKVNIFKPPTSRMKSSETYIIAIDRKEKRNEQFDRKCLISDE